MLECYFHLIVIQGMTEGWQRLKNFAFLGKLDFLPSHQERPQVGPVAEDRLLRADEPRSQLVHKDLRQRVVENRVQRFPGKQFRLRPVGRAGHRVPRQCDDEASVAFAEIDALLSKHLLHFEQRGARRRRRQLELAGVQGLTHERPLRRNTGFECPNFMQQIQTCLTSVEPSRNTSV